MTSAVRGEGLDVMTCAAPPEITDSSKGNNVLPSSSSRHEQQQSNEYSIDIETLKELLGPAEHYNEKEILGPMPDQCCIYKVPTDLRKIKEEAYTPQVISIGPFHHGKRKLKKMEKQKLRYVSEFCKRTGRETLIEFKKFIKENEKRIRDCYAEYSNLTSSKFITIILCDAVFIVEFVLKNYKSETEKDFFLRTPCVKNVIARDLLLLENQLPYFVLEDLYIRVNSLLSQEHPEPFLIPSFQLLGHILHLTIPRPDIVSIFYHEIQHLTDLGLQFVSVDRHPNHPGITNNGINDIPCATYGNEEQSKSKKIKEDESKYKEGNVGRKDLPCATRLHESGVKFIKGNSDQCLTDIRCQYAPSNMSIPWFTELQLQIPIFEVYDFTECWIRNIMALEMCHYGYKNHLCNYIWLLDNLIDTEKDVDLLVDEGIIVNGLGDNTTLAKMFNNLCLQIVTSHDAYSDVTKTLIEHYDNSWNHTKAKLRRTYFNDLWTGTATAAAVILLLLTFMQTMCSVLPVL